MLVLRRELNQRVYLDTLEGQIEVTIVELGRGFVRLGFDAPKSVAILRDDVKDSQPKERGTV